MAAPSSTPAASIEDLAIYGWTAVPVDPEVIFSKTPIVKPSPLKVADLRFPCPRTKLYAKEHLPEQTYNHCMRVFYFGYSILRDQFPAHRKWLSLSTWAMTCLLHDIGTTHDNLRGTLLSFEFFGGILALNLAKEFGAETAEAEAIAEAIIRHQDLGKVGTITIMGQILQLATIYDNVGGYPELIDEATRLDVNEAFPRMGWSGCFANTVREEIALKPWAHSTHLGAEEFPERVENNTLMADVDDWESNSIVMHRLDLHRHYTGRVNQMHSRFGQ